MTATEAPPALDWLSRYTFPDSSVPIWERVHRGWGRSFVSDSRSLLLVDDPAATLGEPPVWMSKPGRQQRLASMALAAPPSDAPEADLLDLWAWIGQHDRFRCPWCGGTGDGTWLGNGGERPDVRGPDCDECSGRGWYEPVPDPIDAHTVKVCGLPVDRNRLAWWLPGELEGHGTRVRFWRVTLPPSSVEMVAFDGGGWRLVVTTLKPESHPGRYRAYVPGAGAWWTHRRCGVSRLVAADWCEERGMDPVDLFGVNP